MSAAVLQDPTRLAAGSAPATAAQTTARPSTGTANPSQGSAGEPVQAMGATARADVSATPDLNADPDADAASQASAALALYAQVLAAGSLQAAAHRVVATLVEQLGLSRAAIGLVEGPRLRLLAISDTGLDHDAAELPQRLLGAMQEALEQAVSLAWPPGAGAAAVQAAAAAQASAPCQGAAAAGWIRLEHQLLQRQGGGAVASVPLGAAGELFAAVCVERQAGPAFEAGELARLEQLLVLAAPAMRWMHRAALPWHRRTADALVQAWAALRQPERRSSRRLMAGAAAALAFLALAPLEHDVSGRARVEGAEQRALVAPADGFVKAVHVRPGDPVKAGAPLLDLLDGDLRLERERWSSQLAQHENAYAAAMAKADRTGAATSLSRIGEAQSQLALVDDQLARGRVVAPFDALVIQGDLSRSIGAPVRQGDTLLTLATTGHHRIVVEVDEVDIARVQPGQRGRLTLSSLAWSGDDIVVERIMPLARAVEGRNVFEVEARLVEARADLRPGLLGRAELVVGRRPPLWVWTAHALDRLRVAWWSWLG